MKNEHIQNASYSQNNLNINHVPGETMMAETLFDKRVSVCNYAMESLPIDKNKVNFFLNELKILYPSIIIKDFNIRNNNFFQIEEQQEEIFIQISVKPKVSYIHLYTKNLNQLHDIFTIYKKYSKDLTPEPSVSFSVLAPAGNGHITETTRIRKLKDYKDINPLYYPFLNVDLLIKEFISGDENILILAGEAGTGKSKFTNLIIKELLLNPQLIECFQEQEDEDIEDKNDKNNNLSNISSIEFNENLKIIEEIEGMEEKDYISVFDMDEDPTRIYVGSAKNVDMLALDNFWKDAGDYDIIILDDLDFLLSSRKETREDTLKNQFLSHLLSFTDGVDNNNTKIIITTNQAINTIDDALLRRGRLFSILNFRKLKEQEALAIWLSEGLAEEEFYDYIDEFVSDTDNIRQSDIAEAIKNIKRNKKYINKKEFILDDSIDALKKTVTKAGFVR